MSLKRKVFSSFAKLEWGRTVDESASEGEGVSVRLETSVMRVEFLLLRRGPCTQSWRREFGHVHTREEERERRGAGRVRACLDSRARRGRVKTLVSLLVHSVFHDVLLGPRLNC